MINTKALICRAKTLGIRQKDIADALGLCHSVVSQKFNNVRPMRLDEAEVIAEILHISNEEFGDFFFSHKSKELRKKECGFCKWWSQFYVRAYGGRFMKVDCGLCMKHEHWGVHEKHASCNDHQYGQEEE